MTQQPKRSAIAPQPPNASKAKSGGGKNKKVANSLVALSSAAILSIYGIGYVRTNAAQTLDNVDAPVIAIATAAPSAMDAASSPIAAYQSPLFPPPTVAATSISDGSMQGPATTTAAPPMATSDERAQGVATATADLPTATPAAAAASVPASAVTAPATATGVPPTATTAPLPRATSLAPTMPSSAAKVTATAVATRSPATTALYKDGTYSGTGTSRHGNISASIVVQGGKIVSAAITQCGTRYPCSDIAALPGEVVSRQSATIDAVSGATDSSQAYRGAIQNALAKAKGSA